MKRLLLAAAVLVAGAAAKAADASALKTPNISGNALFLYRNSNFAKEDTDTTNRNGLDLQEAELAFYSDVDPYSRLNMLLTVHPQYNYNKDTGRVEKTWVVGPEELFAESDEVQGVTLKVGQFKAAFGKHNQLHTHAYPLVDAPVVNDALLGDEGLSDVGLSAAILLPVSNWFSELTLQYLAGGDGNPEYDSATPGDGVGIVHFKNLFDLNDSSTLEGGLSFAQGGNSLRGTTSLYGLDLTMKWRPVDGGKYHSGLVGLEYMERHRTEPGLDDELGQGGFLFAQYQIAERWALVARTEWLKVGNSLDTDVTKDANALLNDTTTKNSVSAVFTATEFSSYRIEFDRAHGPAKNGQADENKVYLQANFTIGSHPAHAY